MSKLLMSCCIRCPWKNRITVGFGHRLRYSTSGLLPELELAFNNQINKEFSASFTYLAMAAFFGRQSVSLPGCHKYFMDQVLDEWGHGKKFIQYLNRRGNAVFLQAIPAPTNQEWESPLAAFTEASELEKCITQHIIGLVKSCEEKDDKCACNFLESEFLETQLEESDRLSRHVTELEKIGPNNLGIYLFDRYLLKSNKS